MDTPDFAEARPRRHGLATAALIGSGIVLGALLAGSVTAQAADPTPTPSTTTSVPDRGPGDPGNPGDLRGGSGGHHRGPDGRDCPDEGGAGGGGGGTTDTSPSTTPSQTNTPSV